MAGCRRTAQTGQRGEQEATVDIKLIVFATYSECFKIIFEELNLNQDVSMFAQP